MTRKKQLDAFIWTECFNCPQIALPMVRSFLEHHAGLNIHVLCFQDESSYFQNLDSRIIVLSPSESFLNRLFLRDERAIRAGYRKKGHLGTARSWANTFYSIKSDYFIHLDSDQIFLGDLVSEILERLRSGFDLVGTRRPYLFRSYRKEGRDSIKLDKLPDSLNTDLIGFHKGVIGTLFSPFLVRRVRGRKTSSKPVIDFFDPLIHQALFSKRKIFFLDSQSTDLAGQVNSESRFYTQRLQFAAVGSGMNFYSNPESSSSPGYREYALQAYALWSKYFDESPIDYKRLDAPELEAKLNRLDQVKWVLRDA